MKLIDNTPIGTRTGLAFVDWRDDSKPNGLDGALREVESPKYSPEAVAFGDFVRMVRVASNRSIREVAKALGLTAGRYCDIERGAARPAERADVRELVAAVTGTVVSEPKVLNVETLAAKNPPRYCKTCRRTHTADSSCWRPKP